MPVKNRHVLISPDKFKGSLSAAEVCQAVARGVKSYNSDIEALLHPLADGGEGTLEVLSSALDLETIEVTVSDPLFRPVQAHYKKRGKTAYVEMSQASGLLLLTKEERNCTLTSTYGTGELLLDAIKKGVEEIYLFIGGSATNDGGLGMAQALGYQFTDQSDQPIQPIGKELINLGQISDQKIKFDPEKITYKVVCDVQNKLSGKTGAAYVYGPQKGASAKDLSLLDNGLWHLGNVLKQKYGKDFARIPGSGAAGGLGAGAMAFLGATLVPGIETIMDITDFEAQIEKAGLVITGEGRIDAQTVHGKVIAGVNKKCQEFKKTLGIICGAFIDQEIVKNKIKAPIYPLKSEKVSTAYAFQHAEELIEKNTIKLLSDMDF